ncbi:MAG: hypothetical protein GOMPHAMPRED_003260 [Gomphillus americanus]|uniref:Uncharacterized protein n=1 Tax=Gomphillus americanus TaxID=1940652 RepID=A0A8H3I369_9LECA|nr:MAG: hypothetical protein GOMPHAMPRED_003260 [Gomphillus americanus]
MASIVRVTMLYLPAAFIATIFSMPFFSLDDNQNFSNINKLWIYVVVSLICTILTFVLPMLWRIARRLQTEAKAMQNSDEGTSDIVQDPTLEPLPYNPPTIAQLTEGIQRIIDTSQNGRTGQDDSRQGEPELEESELDIHDGGVS